MKIVSPITFIDKLVKKNELGQPFALTAEQREILRLAFAFDSDGRLPWDTILYSCIKKSGKTTINGALTLAWAFTQEAPNEKKTLRPGTYLRLHENRWATAEEAFITPEMWDPCVNPAHHPNVLDKDPLFVGVDAGIKHDNAARVAVKWDDQGERLILVSHRIWKPTPSQPLDLENTIEQDLLNLNDSGDVVEILCDPYQLHRSIMTLQSAGLPIREFPQTQANCTLMGQNLFDLLAGRNLDLYADDELRQQALSTVAIENPRGWRIAKEKSSKKIDAIVALAMACAAAMAHRGEIGSRAARGFNKALHVASETLTPHHGQPIYIGQTLVDMPATVIAQCDRGAVQVLAAFASEGMGLRRHVEGTVKPWLLANARWALNNNQLLLGTFEDIDQQSESDLLQIIEDSIGGIWEKTNSRWESRRDSVLELIGKSVPGLFKPALQIDPGGGKLLVEALAGRWSYEQDRRNQRTTWHHVANAFSLLVSTIEPTRPHKEIKVLASLDKEHFDGY